MKSYPSCWNKTLALLGFSRKPRKAGKSFAGRLPKFETLETREMLTVAGPVNTLLDVVNSSDDLYSLREAINDANVGNDQDTIQFATELSGTIVLGSTLPTISKPLTIDGPGAEKLAISGKDLSRVLNIAPGNNVGILDIAITKGTTGAQGGGIYNAGNLALHRVDVVDNHAGDGGGGVYVALGGSLNVLDSTFANNTTSGSGGGIGGQFGAGTPLVIANSTFYSNDAATGGGLKVLTNNGGGETFVRITNTTFSENHAESTAGAINLQSSSSGHLLKTTIVNTTIVENRAKNGVAGGIYNVNPSQSTVTLYNSILAGNSAGDANFQEAWGSLNGTTANPSKHNLVGIGTSSGNGHGIQNGGANENIVGTAANPINPLLAPLGDYGGTTKTRAPLPGSPVIEEGNTSIATSNGLTVDQRGFTRAVGTVDIGAAEVPPLLKLDADGDHRDGELQFDAGTGVLLVVTMPSGEPRIKNWGELDDAITWVNLKTGDFNGDGRDDIVVQNGVSKTWTIAISEGNAFVAHDTQIVGNWIATYIGDFDGDGNDELLGKPASGSWQILKFADVGGAYVETLSGTQPNLTGAIFIGDANRDGRDDLLARTSSTVWNVALSQAGGTTFGSTTNWGNWFESAYQASPTNFDPYEPYKNVLDIFSDIYNNYELEFYYGLMKGPEATAETKAGNTWDQAALLVERLQDAGVEADLAIGNIDVPVAVLKEWIGSPDTSTGTTLRDNIRNTLLNLGIAAINVSSTVIRIAHTWVEAKVPTSQGLTKVFLDPSWKFKNRNPGFLPSTLTGVILPFDQLDYLTSIRDELALEYYEDQLASWLSTNHPGSSLADVAFDGPIRTRNFETLPIGMGSQVVVHDANQNGLTDEVQRVDDFDAILTTAGLKEDFTHRVIIKLTRLNSSSSSRNNDVLLTHEVTVPDAAYQRFTITTAVNANPDLVIKELINGVTTTTTVPAGGNLIAGEDIKITITHLDPGQSSSSTSLISNDYVQDVGTVVAIGLDANQFTTQSTADLQEYLLTELAVVDAGDIDDLLIYTVAAYWEQGNSSNETAAGLMNKAYSKRRVGSGIATAKSTYDEFDYLNYRIAPDDMGVDLKNGTGFFYEWNGTVSAEANRLSVYNASGLEHTIVEETINSASVSTIKGLQRAYQRNLTIDENGAPVSNDLIHGIESYWNSTLGQREYYYRGQWDKDLPNSFVAYSTATLDNSAKRTEAQIRSLLTNTLTPFKDQVIAALNATHQDPIRVLVPDARTKLDNWVGGVFVAESISASRLSFSMSIAPDGGPIQNGGYTGGVVEPNSPILPPTNFTNAPFAGDPVNTANGSMFREDVDILFPNLGIPLDFSRHYNSNSKEDLGLGVGWTYSFGDVLIRDPDGTSSDLIWIAGNGEQHKLKSVGGGNYEEPAALHGTMIKSGSTYIYRDKSGEEFVFDNLSSNWNSLDLRGRLIKHVDNVGNGIEVIYGLGNPRRIAEVRDIHTPDRRLGFSYNSTSDVITQIDKFSANVNVGTWNLAYQTITGTNGYTDYRLSSVQAPQVASINHLDQEVLARPTVAYGYLTSGHNKGLVNSIAESDGGLHAYEYYANGRVFRVTDSVGNQQIFNYNLFRTSTEFVNENGATETYIHQENGLLSKQIHDDRTRLSFSWGKIGTSAEYLMASSTDERGAIESFKYYVTNADLFEGTDHEVVITSNTFRNRELYESTAKHYPAESNPLITRFDYSRPTGNYDHIINLKRITVNPGSEEQRTDYTYNSFGQLLTTTDALNHQVTRTYYQPGEELAYYDGLLKTVTSSRPGVPGATMFTYDAAGNSLSAQTDGLPTSTIAYDHLGNLLSVLSPTVEKNVYVYDALGRRRESKLDPSDNATIIVSRFSYDAKGRVRFSADPLSRITEFEYDAKGQLVRQINPDETQLRFAYDGLGNRISATDELGRTTRFVYDNRQRLIETIYCDGTSTRIRYNGTGQIVSTFDELGRETKFSYDSAGRLLTTTNANAKTALNDYDHLGRLETATDYNGNVTKYQYDKLNRVVDQRVFVASTTPGTPNMSVAPLSVVTYDYDENGNLDRTIVYNTNSFNYTAANFPSNPRSLATSQNIANNFVQVTETIYDALNRPVETIYADSTSTRTVHDDAGRVQFTYDELDRQTTLEYDTYGRLVRTIAPDPDGAAPQLNSPVTQFFYDAAGNQVAVIDPRNNTTHFEYDARNRLVETTDALGGKQQTLYDAAGQVVASSDALGRVTYTLRDERGRIVLQREADPDAEGEQLAPETRFEYDAVGNVREKIDPLGNITSYAYDNLNRLTQEVFTNTSDAKIVDDGSSNWGVVRSNGQPPTVISAGWDGDARIVAPSTTSNVPNAVARWNFTDLFAGEYRAYVTWDANSLGSLDIPTVQYFLDGSSTQFATFTGTNGNQTSAPVGIERMNGDVIQNWVSIGSPFSIAGDGAHTISIRIHSLEQQNLIADAVRLERIDTRSYSYDNNGNRLTATDTLGRTTDYTYDSLNRQASITLPDSDGAGGNPALQTF